MLSVWVVDDEQNIRDLIKRYLETEGYSVRTFASAEAVNSALITDKPDMIILDIMLPGSDGLALCRQIRAKSGLPIIFVSARGEEFDRVLGLELGADDYLGKPFSPRELIVRVNTIFRRLNKSVSHEDESYTLGNININPVLRKITINENEVILTKKELALFMQLASQPNRPFSREQLLESIWGYDYDGEDRAVDDTVKRIRKKMREKGARPELATVWGYGYKLNV